MTVIPFELARIEDEGLRDQAITLWLSQLSEQERQELSDTIFNIVVGFVPFVEAVGDACRGIVESIVKWVEANPDLMAYLETLETESKL